VALRDVSVLLFEALRGSLVVLHFELVRSAAGVEEALEVLKLIVELIVGVPGECVRSVWEECVGGVCGRSV
jgi:hypothetical protein